MSEPMALDVFDKKLLEVGFDNMSLYDKNQLLVNIGAKQNVDYNKLTEEDILEYHKKLKRNELSNYCNDEVVNGFTATNGDDYRLNRDDQINFLGKMIQIMNDSTISIIQWKTENQGYREHTREEWIKVFNEGLIHKEATLFKYNSLVNSLENAETHDEIVEVSWNDNKESDISED